MIREFLEYLVNLGEDRAIAQKDMERAPWDSRKWITPENLTLMEEQTFPTVAFRDLASLVSYVKIHGKPGRVEVYFSSAKYLVQALMDYADRRHAAIVELTTSTAWCGISKWLTEGHSFEQKELLRWLRFEQLDTTSLLDLRESAAHLDFKRRNDGSRTVEHGRESMGKQVEAVVQGSGEIPRVVEFVVRPFSTDGLQRIELVLKAGVELEPAEERIRLQLLPGEWERAHRVMEREALSLLFHLFDEGSGEATVPVFLGTPTA